MSTATRPLPWYRTAANPPCPASWCDVSHEPDEFTADGSLFCRRTIAATPAYSVEVQQAVGTNQTEDGYAVEPAHVWFWTSADELTEATAHELGLALVRAGDLIRRERLTASEAQRHPAHQIARRLGQ